MAGATLKWDQGLQSRFIYRHLVKTTKRIVNEIADKARTLAPVGETGNLRDSIAVEVFEYPNRIDASVGILKGTLKSADQVPADDYSTRVHYGFRDMDEMGRNVSQQPDAFIWNAVGRSVEPLLRKFKEFSD